MQMLHATRRSLLLLLVLLFTIAVVTACGSGQKEEGNNNTAEEEEKPATRMYTHVMGETEIPTEPRRIVSDWYYGDLVAVGVKPIGLTSYVLNNHPFIETAGTEDVGDLINAEKSLELEPDLIILYGQNQNYEQISKIAPTIALELYPDPYESVRLFGELVNKPEAAEAWIEGFEQEVEEAKRVLNGKIGERETFTIFNVWRDTIRVYGDVNMGGYVVYKALGLKPQERVLEEIINGSGVNSGIPISMEEIASFAGDHIILTSFQGEELLKELTDSALWRGLDAVKNNKVYPIDFNLLYNEDPVAMQEQLSIIANAITAGNP